MVAKCPVVLAPCYADAHAVSANCGTTLALRQQCKRLACQIQGETLFNSQTVGSCLSKYNSINMHSMTDLSYMNAVWGHLVFLKMGHCSGML